MTRDQQIILHNGGTITPTVLAIPVLPNKCVETPQNLANEGVPKQLTQDDYNAIPISDMEAMHALKNQDPLHGLESLAEQHKKGSKLKAIAKVQGNKKFAQNYNVTLDD